MVRCHGGAIQCHCLIKKNHLWTHPFLLFKSCRSDFRRRKPVENRRFPSRSKVLRRGFNRLEHPRDTWIEGVTGWTSWRVEIGWQPGGGGVYWPPNRKGWLGKICWGGWGNLGDSIVDVDSPILRSRYVDGQVEKFWCIWVWKQPPSEMMFSILDMLAKTRIHKTHTKQPGTVYSMNSCVVKDGSVPMDCWKSCITG